MITGIHAIIFTHDADRTRAFFRDTLGFDYVDAGGGWLIFALPPAELAAHPTDAPPHHELYFMCDDIDATVEDMKTRGVGFTNEITDERWGRTTTLKLPGDGRVALYEARHPSPLHPTS